MGKVKKVIIGVLVVTLTAGGTVGAVNYMKSQNQTEVLVASVGSLATDYYSSNTTLEGNISTSVSQHITVDKDMIIQQVYVNKGDNVKKGDTLITFDMTLVEMELNIAKLKLQKEQQDLAIAQNRLTSLQNGGPIEESDTSNPVNADNLNADDSLETTTSPDSSNGDDEMSSTDLSMAGNDQQENYLAYIMPPLLLTAFTDGNGLDGILTEEEETVPEETESTTGDIYQDPTANEFGDGTTPAPEDSLNAGVTPVPSVTTTPDPSLTPTVTPVPGDDVTVFDPSHPAGIAGISDGVPEFYQKLDSSSIPFTGTGTKEDPFIYLCSSAKAKVTVMGSFFNLMAGYSEDGTKVQNEGGYWYQLEFHTNDTITDFLNRKTDCTGYYLMDGGLLKGPVYMYNEAEFTLEGASVYEAEQPIDDSGTYDDSSSDDTTSTVTRDEAIKVQKDKIASLQLDIKESNINISKLEKKVNRKVVYSKLDGTVSYVGDPLTGTSEGTDFITVKSGDGFYVTGSVSELMLDKMQIGTILNCSDYNGQTFEAEVIDVADYPTSSDSFYGDGNPNVSYYRYSASIGDKTLQLTDQDYVSVTLQGDSSDGNSLVLPKAFVKTENGTNYVYKDDHGVLKKQAVTVGATVDSGYSVMITSGVTRDDLIAFPYAKTAQEGVKTREGTLDEFYGY